MLASALARALPRKTKDRLKGWRKQMWLAYVRRWRAFGPGDLAAGLRAAGLAPGQLVMVHSSYDQFAGFTGKPSDVIQVLQDVVGPGGTVLMPTLPFTGTAVEYTSRGTVFDVARTPSRMGLLTEMFRRSPGVIRSVHPTHAVAAWGARAAEMVANHHLTRTPCGKGSPFARLLEHDGRILLLGVTIESMTFYHYVEEALEPDLPDSPFTSEEFTLESRDATGAVLTSRMRLYDPAVSRRRDLTRLVPVLRRDGAWSERRVGQLRFVLLDATSVLAACRRLAAQGVYCYE